MRNASTVRTRGTALILWGVTALLLSAGCATTVKTNVLMPGKFDEAAKFKSVAVMPFDGPDGKALTSVVESTLASVIIDDKQYFKIVDRGSLDKAMGEMQLSMTGIVDTNTAAQVGRMVGAKGIYTGIVTASTVNDARYTEKRKKCSSYKSVTDSKGKKTDECAQWYDSDVSCTKRTVSFAFTPKLVEVETSRLVFSNTYDSSLETKGCSDDSKGLEDGQVMKRKAQDEAVKKLRMDVAPYYAVMEFTLKDDASDIPQAAGKAKLKDGLKFAAEKRMDRACELWSEAKVAAPNSITLLYNLGICAETQGKPDEALAMYRQVDKMLTKPDDLVNKALARTTDMVEKRKKLGQQVAK